MFLVSVPTGPTCLKDVSHCSSQIATLVSIDDTSFVVDAILILAGH